MSLRLRTIDRLLLMITAALSAVLAAGCTGPGRPPPPPAPALTDRQQPAWQWIDAGRYRMQLAHLASLRNTGLQLPVPSPDGKWVAAWDCSDALALDPDAALTGSTLSNTTLVLRRTSEPQVPHHTVASGVAWPIWTPDSQQLIAVAYDRAGHCALLIHELSTAKSRRIDIGLRHILTLALSPQGRRLALAGFDDGPEKSKLYVYDLQKQVLTPLVPPRDAAWQVAPMWISERALLYYGRVGSDVGLLGAAYDGAEPHSWLAKLPLPQLAAEVLRVQAGITQPLSPDGRWLAMYDISSGNIVLHRLEDGRTWPLASNSHAGCWAGASQGPRFIYATDKQLLLSEPEAQSRVLATSPLLPLWCHSQGRELLLLARGHQEWTFELLRMEISAAP